MSFAVLARSFLRRLMVTVALSTVAVGAVGCDDDPTGNESVVGTYALTTVNGRSLPFTITSSTQFFAMDEDDEIVSGLVRLNANNTFFFEIVAETPEATARRIEGQGTWSRNANRITLTGTGASTEVQLDGNRILVAGEEFGLPLVFTKSS